MERAQDLGPYAPPILNCPFRTFEQCGYCKNRPISVPQAFLLESTDGYVLFLYHAARMSTIDSASLYIGALSFCLFFSRCKD